MSEPCGSVCFGGCGLLLLEQASSYDVNVGGAGLALAVPTSEVGAATDGLHLDFCL